MITSRVTRDAQTTIPEPVRAALHLEEGDTLAYEITDGKVILTRAPARAAEDPFGTFTEWDGDCDRKAYARL